jgi:hypothetical protein
MNGEAVTPIDVAPARRPLSIRALRRARVAAGWVHLALALAIVAGVVVQVYLIGAYIFGAGPSALDYHRSMGWTVHGFELMLFAAALAAWLPRLDVGLSFVLAAVGTAQVSLASGHRWVGGLHPVLALVVVALATALALRATSRHRAAGIIRRRPRTRKALSRLSAKRMLLVGGMLGSCLGVIGASISDPEVGFPAWIDLTGVVAGFGIGVLVSGTATVLRSRRSHGDV